MNKVQQAFHMNILASVMHTALMGGVVVLVQLMVVIIILPFFALSRYRLQ